MRAGIQIGVGDGGDEVGGAGAGLARAPAAVATRLLLPRGPAPSALAAPSATHPRRARAATGAAAVVLVALWAVATLLGLDIPRRHDLLGTAGALAAPAVVVLAIALLLWSVRAHRDGIAFAASSLAIAGLLAIVGLSLYPDVLPAADPSRSLTVTGAASSDLTLSVMLVVALIGMPLVIAYTAFVYLRFRGAASSEETAY